MGGEKRIAPAGNRGDIENLVRTGSTSTSVGLQLRARRDAALRLPPLESGYRDPLDECPPMSDREARRVANALAGDGWSVEYLARRFGLAVR